MIGPMSDDIIQITPAFPRFTKDQEAYADWLLSPAGAERLRAVSRQLGRTEFYVDLIHDAIDRRNNRDRRKLMEQQSSTVVAPGEN